MATPYAKTNQFFARAYARLRRTRAAGCLRGPRSQSCSMTIHYDTIVVYCVICNTSRCIYNKLCICIIEFSSTINMLNWYNIMICIFFPRHKFGFSLKLWLRNPYGKGSHNRLTCLLCEKLVFQNYKYYNIQQDMKSDIANISVKFTNRCEKRDIEIHNYYIKHRYTISGKANISSNTVLDMFLLALFI